MIEPWSDTSLSVEQRLVIALEAINFKNLYINALEDKLRRAETDLLLIRSQREYEENTYKSATR